MIVASGIAMQFGAKPLFENVSVKFGSGNRYGLIGANGCGKSPFMKILGGDLEPAAGTVAIDKNERVGKLRQDQFAYEDERVLDVVLMGHAELWQAMRARDAIDANPDSEDDDFIYHNAACQPLGRERERVPLNDLIEKHRSPTRDTLQPRAFRGWDAKEVFVLSCTGRLPCG